MYIYHVISKLTKALFLVAFAASLMSNSSNEPPKVSKTFTVRDGLPQSFVSGLFQDEQGFLWVSSLNGLGRYDGRELLHFQHTSRNAKGISGNIIFQLFPINPHTIWICYQDGKIDQFNTISGAVDHLWENRGFEQLKNESGYFRSLTGSNSGIYWMMSIKGGLYRIDAKKKKIAYVSTDVMNFREKILGICAVSDQLIVFTETIAWRCDKELKKTEAIAYPFGKLVRYDNDATNIYSPSLRKNGDLIFADGDGLKVWNMVSNQYTVIHLKRDNAPGKLISTFDHKDNYYFEHNKGVFILNSSNKLVNWWPVNPHYKGIPISMCIDKSGVFWMGTNGFGLRRYNNSNTGLNGYESKVSFVYDVLASSLGSSKKIENTFLKQSVVFANRCATRSDSVWIADVNILARQPQLLLKTNKGISIKTFKNGKSKWHKESYQLKFISFDPLGTLWAIDQQARLLKFDTKNYTFQIQYQLNIDPSQEINGMVIDRNEFFITTTKGLFNYNYGFG